MHKNDEEDYARQKHEMSVGSTCHITTEFLKSRATPMQASELPDLIRSIYDTVSSLGGPKQEPVVEPTPAVPVKKSITPDFLISLEDGKRYKSLKRHLSNRGLTPQQYRQKWGLPADYPMVSPNYAKTRSELAKAAGLGKREVA